MVESVKMEREAPNVNAQKDMKEHCAKKVSAHGQTSYAAHGDIQIQLTWIAATLFQYDGPSISR